MTRDEHEEKFRAIRSAARKHGYRWLASPIYQDFLTGERKLACAPWGSITRNPYGWKGPCYLLTDGIFPTYEALLDGHRVGGVRPGQRRALRALRDPLRLRALGRLRGDRQRQGDRPQRGMDADGVTLACATAAELRVARRSGVRSALVGLGARNGLPEGPLVSFGLAGALRDGLAPGTVVDATRVVDVEGTVLWDDGPLGVPGARAGDDPGRRARSSTTRPSGARCTSAPAPTRPTSRAGRSRAAAACKACCARSATRRRARSTGSSAASGPTAATTGPASRRRSPARRAASSAQPRTPVARSGGSATQPRGGRDRPGPARRAALVLRRSRPRDRDRRDPARAARSAGLRPPPDRPQRPRRQAARGARRGLRRPRERDPGRRDLRPLRPRRRAVGAGELRGARPARGRRGLPARLEGARRGAALRRQRPPGRARRPCRPRRGDRHARRAARGDGRDRVARGRGASSTRAASRSR